VPFAPPFGAIHAAWEAPAAIDAWIARAPSATLTPERLRAVVDDHRHTHVAVAPYTQSSARLREALGELAVDALARDVRDRTLELLAAIDDLDYTSDVLERADHLPVNTLTAPVFDHDGRVAFAVALHLADPDDHDPPPDRVASRARGRPDVQARGSARWPTRRAADRRCVALVDAD